MRSRNPKGPTFRCGHPKAGKNVVVQRGGVEAGKLRCRRCTLAKWLRYNHSPKGQATQLRTLTKNVTIRHDTPLAVKGAHSVRAHWLHDSQCVAVLSDIQLPFEDSTTLDLTLRFIQDINPDTVILNGDILDCYELSDFDRDPRHSGTLGQERAKLAALVTRLKGRRIVYLGGNHEHRWRRQLWRAHQTRQTSLAILQEALRYIGADPDDADDCFRRVMVPMGVTDYFPHGHFYYLAEGNLVVTHGFKISQHSAYSAKQTFERLGKSCIVGHTHRLGTYYATNIASGLGDMHGAWENGCLCQLEPEYLQFANWQQGFSVVTVSGPRFSVTQIPILTHATGRSLRYGGKEWMLREEDARPLIRGERG